MSEQQPQPQQQMMHNPENEDNILQTLFGYFATFVRPYMWLYPTAAILFLAGGLLFIKTATPIYSSTAEMKCAHWMCGASRIHPTDWQTRLS